MSRLVKWALLLALVFSALWLGAAFALQRGLAGWFEARRAEGWQAEYARLESRGFPVRLEMRLVGLALADPETGLAWRAPDFAFSAPVWNPGRISAIWPEEQLIATPLGKIALRSRRMQAAVAFNRFADLNLARIALDLAGLLLSSGEGWESALEEGRLVLEQAEGAPYTYRLHFEAAGMVPASPVLRAIAHVGRLSERIEGVRLDALVTFDAPWDRFAIEDRRPQVTRIRIERLSADWGEVALWMAGALEVDAEGTPSGQITVRAKNWREMVALARAAGILPEAFEESVVKALDFLASLSGDRSTLDTPLTFRNGYVAFGPFPLGPAPDLTIR